MNARSKLAIFLLSTTTLCAAPLSHSLSQPTPATPEQRREEPQGQRLDQRQDQQQRKERREERSQRQQSAPPSAAQNPAAPQPNVAQPSTSPADTPAVNQPARPQRPAATGQERPDERQGREQRREEPRTQPSRQSGPAAAPAEAPGTQRPSSSPPASVQEERRREQRPDRGQSREERLDDRRTPPAASQQPASPDRGREQRSAPSAPSATQNPPASSPAPQQPPLAQPQVPAASPAAPSPDRRERTGDRPITQPGSSPTAPTPSTTQQQPAPSQTPGQNTPATANAPQSPATAPLAPASTPAAVPPPTQARRSNQFIQQRGAVGSTEPPGNINAIKQERQETRQGDRIFIREPDRTIIREGGRTIIRHNEANRFAIDARDVRVQQRSNGHTETIIVRPNGARIVTITDRDGRLVRRSRFDDRGREIVIIDNRFIGAAAAGMVPIVNLAPPVYRGPRERYILEYAPSTRPEVVYEVLEAPPIERLERRYTLDQVRFNAPLRDRMPRVDLDVHFETGSWLLTAEQIDKLAVLADGIKRAIARNPREVFMIEGHTDAVGSDEDNLSLSDRRAEAVAVALTEQFEVPAENLVTQGYGEQHLKEQTAGPSPINRRVALRRITPLLDQRAENPPRQLR